MLKDEDSKMSRTLLASAEISLKIKVPALTEPSLQPQTYFIANLLFFFIYMCVFEREIDNCQ